jgi:hypothetical protein
MSAKNLSQWAENNPGYKKLSPARAQRLQGFINEIVELFARGHQAAEDHLVGQVRVLNELASNIPAGKLEGDGGNKRSQARKDSKNSS